MIRQRRLRWLCRVRRMEDCQIPEDVLYGKLASGKRSVGRPQLRYKHVCERDLKALDINTEIWEDTTETAFMALLAHETAEHR